MSSRSDLLPSMKIIGAASLMASIYCAYKNYFSARNTNNGENSAISNQPVDHISIQPMPFISQEQKAVASGNNKECGPMLKIDNTKIAGSDIPKKIKKHAWHRFGKKELKKGTNHKKFRIFGRRKENVLSTPVCFPKNMPNSTFLKEALTEDVYEKLSVLATSFGSTLEDCIRPGLDSPEGDPNDYGKLSCDVKACGLVALDADCYNVFRPLFHKIAEFRHPKYTTKTEEQRRSCDLTKFPSVKLPEFNRSQVFRLYIELHRNLKGHKFPPGTDRESRRHTKNVIISALSRCTKNVSVLYDMTILSNEDQALLKSLNLLPESPKTPYELSVGLRRDWPDGRAVWYCKDEEIAAILNVVDHVVLIATTNDGKLDALGRRLSVFYQKFVNELNAINEQIAIDDFGDFGCLTSFPEHLGPATVFRAKIRLSFGPNKRGRNLAEILPNNFGFVVNDMRVDETKSCIFLTIESKLSLGSHDGNLLQMFVGGIERILKMEKDHLNETNHDYFS